MNQTYLLASGFVFLALAFIWSKDTWLNYGLKLGFIALALWAAVQWGILHGVIR